MKPRLPVWLVDACLHQPAAPIALAMFGGIGLGRFVLPVWPWTWLCVASALLLLAILFRARGWIATTLLTLCAGVAGIAALDLALYRYPANDLALYSTDEARLCFLRLYLPNEPRLRESSIGGRVKMPPRQATIADVREVLTPSGWQPASGSVLVQVQEARDDLHAGQTIEAVARLERPGAAMNPGQFDWQRYYRDQRILASIRIRRADNIAILDRATPPWLTQWREAMRGLLARGFTESQSLDHALLGALVLGDYDPELRDIAEQFRHTGTSHHLAISGMHIAVVGGLVFLVLRLFGFGPRACWSAGLLIVGLYGAAAMPSPPVMRAMILFGVVGGAVLLRRFASSLHLLALTVAIMVALHPLDLFNAGFQLSFGTVLGLLLLSEPLAARWAGEHNILLPDEIAKLPARAKVIRWIDQRNVQVWATGLIAWVVSMPLVATHFTRLNPWQVPASIALAPLVTLSLVAGVLKIGLTAICPPAAPLLATLAATSSSWMRDLVEFLARAPYADVPLTAPPMWLVVLVWVSLMLAIPKWRATSLRLGSIALLVASLAYMLVGPYWFGSSHTLKSGQTRVTIMAVGAGQCALVEPAGGRKILIDCGSTSLVDLAGNVLRPLLREYGITSLDSVVLSHANTDHYGVVAEVADAYGVREILASGVFAKQMRDSPTGVATMRELNALDLPPRVLRPGDRVPLGKDTFVDVLWPEPDVSLEANDTSLVVRVVKGERSVMFTGDIQAAGMKGLIDRGDIHADVLIAPHHGSSEDITPRFVDAVAPKWIVASNDRTLTAKQLRFDEMMKGRDVLRTHEHGAVTVLIDDAGEISVQGFLAPASAASSH